MSETNISQRLRLYLIRHGEIEPAAIRRLIGHTDVALSERGVAQAHRLAKKFASTRLDAIYSSDLRRACRTAEIIAECNRVRVQSSSAWREINMGDWEGRTISELNHEAQKMVTLLFRDPASFEYPKGESFTSFQSRVQEALDQLLLTHRNGEVALIAHGGVCRAIIGTVLGVPMSNWLRLAQRYASLNVIDWYDLQPIVELLNFDQES